jgi:hypothetical protein
LCDEIAGSVANPEEMTQKMQRLNVGLAAQLQYCQQLRQSFSEAMMVLAAPPPPKQNPKPLLPVPEPTPAPRENKPFKFLSALMR